MADVNDLPPLLRDQRKVDAEQLNLLAIFLFVGAGFALLGLVFLGLHCLMFMTIFSDPKLFEGKNGPPPPAAFLTMFKAFYAIGAAFAVTSGVLNLLAGLYLRARKHRMFSLIVAGLNCIHMPLGTILGIFTIIVLSRDSVRELYEANAAADSEHFGPYSPRP